MNNEDKNMIKLTAFYPFSNFLRVTQEFYEDKAIIKSKSLKFENEFEFKYKDVYEISDGFFTQNDQQSFSFSLIVIIGMLLYIFCHWLYENLLWLRIGQLLFISGIILYFASFVRSWHIFVGDKNGNTLFTIKQTHKNKDLVVQAIEKVKEKSSNLEELTTTEPFTQQKASFEHKYFRFANIKRTVDRYYDNEIIGYEKSINGDTSYKIRYETLNGKIVRAKVNNDLWDLIPSWCILIFAMVFGFHFGFNINFFVPVLYIFYALLALIIISWLLSYLKREIFGFYNKNGVVEYWGYVNKNEKEKVEKIIEYVKSRIPEENKE
jgi:ABC-type multidrug transport system fused ATPase/permease subunit